MFERLEPSARRVIEQAIREARAFSHPHVGTEHVLVALALEGPTSELLRAHGCGPDDARREIADILGRGQPQDREPDELLATLGIDIHEVRRRVRSTFGSEAIALATVPRRHRRRWPLDRWWPGCTDRWPHRSALAGRRCTGMEPRLKRVLELATRQAAPIQATSTHVLLGILEEGQGVACQILNRRGVDLRSLSTEARSLAG